MHSCELIEFIIRCIAMAVAQSVRVVGCSNSTGDRPVIKTGSDSSIAKRSSTVVGFFVCYLFVCSLSSQNFSLIWRGCTGVSVTGL